MAPRRQGLRAATTTLAAAAAILISLLLASCSLSDAAAASPTPSTSGAPAPAPFRSPSPPRQQATPKTNPGIRPPPPPPERHRKAHGPRAAPPPPDDGSSLPWHRWLNLGQKVGLALVALAIAMQLAFVAYLAVRARQLRRAANAEAEWSPRPAWQVARDSPF